MTREFGKKAVRFGFGVCAALAALIGGPQEAAALSTGCAALAAASGQQNTGFTSRQFTAGEVITVTASTGYIYYKYPQLSSSFTLLHASFSTTISSTGSYLPYFTSVNSGIYNSGTLTITCVAGTTATTTTTTHTGAGSRSLSTQLSQALPSAQVGNIMHRVDAGLPAPSTLSSTPDSSGKSSSTSFIPTADYSTGGDIGLTGTALVRPYDTGLSLMTDDAGAWIASGAHRNDFARFASLGGFSFNLTDDAPQNGGPPQQRLESLTAKRPQALTVWGQGSVSSLSNSSIATEYSGQVLSYTIGGDYKAGDAFLVGSAFNYAYSDIGTFYNNGQYRERSYTLLPYAAWRPDDVYGLQVVGGLGRGEIGSNSNTANGFVKGDTYAVLWFLSGIGTARLNGNDTPWKIEARFGTLLGRRYVRPYTETSGTANPGTVSTSVQLRPGLEAGYKINIETVTIEPFVRGEQIWDLGDAVNGDHTAWDLSGGMRALQGPAFGSIEYNQEVGRQNYLARTLSGLLGYHFALGDDGGTVSPLMQAGVNNGMQRVGWGLRFEPGHQINLELGMDTYSGARSISTNPTLLSSDTLAASVMTSTKLYRLRMSAPF